MVRATVTWEEEIKGLWGKAAYLNYKVLSFYEDIMFFLGWCGERERSKKISSYI